MLSNLKDSAAGLSKIKYDDNDTIIRATVENLFPVIANRVAIASSRFQTLYTLFNVFVYFCDISVERTAFFLLTLTVVHTDFVL